MKKNEKRVMYGKQKHRLTPQKQTSCKRKNNTNMEKKKKNLCHLVTWERSYRFPQLEIHKILVLLRLYSIVKFLENHYSLFVTYTRTRCKGDTRIKHRSWRGRTNQHKSIVTYSERNPHPINFSHPASSLLPTQTVARPILLTYSLTLCLVSPLCNLTCAMPLCLPHWE